VTSGGTSGTNGWTQFEWRPWAFIALVSLVVVAVNASSDFLEMQRADLDFYWWEPLLWEVTSALVIVAMAPLIGMAVRRWPPTQDNLIRPGLIHFGLTVPFAIVHVVGIFVMRESIYWIADAHYGFFDEGVGAVLFYEWRKDVLTYATIAATYWIFDYIAARKPLPAPSAGDDRIEIRDGATAVFLAPVDILFVEAAGNYVEFHTAGRTHLVRATLAAWEARLTARGFVRVHRSRLVNRANITAIKPTAAGDVEITLKDGRTIPGSRRYRDALEGDAIKA
jgi:LytTr DNA-binding domain